MARFLAPGKSQKRKSCNLDVMVSLLLPYFCIKIWREGSNSPFVVRHNPQRDGAGNAFPCSRQSLYNEH